MRSESDRSYYDSAYEGFAKSVYAAVRTEAFGEEIGQNSWLTADEQRHFIELLGLSASSAMLEVASGSGGPALFIAAEIGCDVTGIDLHESGVAEANAAASARALAERARFSVADARQPLSFDDGSFDALECIDSMNHFAERSRVFSEFHRVLRPGGRVLFTDPAIVTGVLRRDEMIVRSRGMGEFVFTGRGVDEALLSVTGFTDICVEDVSLNMARVAMLRRDARERHAADLREIEGAEAFASVQEFLCVVNALAHDRRLSRLAFVARKPA